MPLGPNPGATVLINRPQSMTPQWRQASPPPPTQIKGLLSKRPRCAFPGPGGAPRIERSKANGENISLPPPPPPPFSAPTRHRSHHYISLPALPSRHFPPLIFYFFNVDSLPEVKTPPVGFCKRPAIFLDLRNNQSKKKAGRERRRPALQKLPIPPRQNDGLTFPRNSFMSPPPVFTIPN